MDFGLPLGASHNLIYQASGVWIPLSHATGVMYYSFLDAGTQSVTLKEAKTSAGGSETNLVQIDTIYKIPNAGGTWTKVTQTASATFDLSTDATNDVMGIYVTASSLSDGFDHVELTAATGTCVAVIVGLAVQRAPENLATNI